MNQNTPDSPFVNKNMSVVLRDCTPAGSLATITSMSFVPEAPKAGDETLMTVNYNLAQAFDSGTATYSILLNGIPFKSTSDLCTQTSCPKEIGDNVEKSQDSFPDVSGKIVSTISWKTQNMDIWCIEATFHIS